MSYLSIAFLDSVNKNVVIFICQFLLPAKENIKTSKNRKIRQTRQNDNTSQTQISKISSHFHFFFVVVYTTLTHTHTHITSIIQSITVTEVEAMVAQLPMNSILLRSRTAILATARICHNHTPSVTLLSSSSSSSPARSYYSSSPEQQSLQQSQLNPSHVQLSPGMTFASPQQQNHVWMSPVRTLIYIYIYNHMSGTFAQCPTKLI